MEGVSLETRAKLEADEQSALLKKALGQLLLVVASLAMFFVSKGRPGDPHFLLVGISALPSISTLWRWWLRRRVDPLEAADRFAAERARVEDEAAVRAAIATHRPYLTYGLAAALILIAGLQAVIAKSASTTIQAAGLVKAAASAGEWWRLISATYIHGGAMHLYGNVFALVVLGHTMETFAPRWHLPVVFVLAGLLGSAASLLFLPATSVGASGAILGIGAYLLTLGLLEPSRLPKSIRVQVLTMIALTFYVGAFGFGFIDNAAHLGGAIGGAFAAFLLTPRGEDRTGVTPRQWNIAGVAAAALIVLSVGGTATVVATSMGRSIALSSVAASIANQSQQSFLVLENRSDRTLEAYRFSVTIDGRTLAAGWRDDCCFGAVSAHQPVAPHSSVRIPVQRAFGVTIGYPKAHVSLAVFDDGTFEGDREEFDELNRQRDFVAGLAAHWRGLIDQQDGADFLKRWETFKDVYAKQLATGDLGRDAGEALGIPRLIFAAGSSPAAYASAAQRAKAELPAVERALRARLAAADHGR